MRETLVRSLGFKDPLEKGTATHSSILAWRIPWTVQFMGSQRVDITERLSFSRFKRKQLKDSIVPILLTTIVDCLHYKTKNKANSVDEQLKGFSALVAQLKTQQVRIKQRTRGIKTEINLTGVKQREQRQGPRDCLK